MSTFRELEIMSLGRVTQVVNSEIAAWIDAISIFADSASGGATQAETRYVDKGGNDVTGNGSFNNPFLTIQAAITSITDASVSKPYAILVGPGVYATAFVIQPWMFVIGKGRNAVVIQNAAANWIGAGFAVAGAQTGGISNCTLQVSTLVVDFTTSSASASFLFHDSLLDGVGWTVTGSAATQRFWAQNIQQLSSAVVNVASFNIPVNLHGIQLINTNLNITNTALYAITCRAESVNGQRAVTLTCNDIVNFISIALHYISTISTPIVVVGSGVIILGRNNVLTTTLPDSDSTISFTTPLVAGAIVGANEGENIYTITPTADRTLTLGDSNPGTRVRIVNLGTTTYVTLAGTFGGLQSYIPPMGVLEYYRGNSVLTPVSVNFPQYGTGVLVNGVSVLQRADIAANSVVHVIATNLNGSAAIGVLIVLDADRVNATRGTVGGFIVRSLTLAGAPVVTDQSSFRWIVIRAN